MSELISTELLRRLKRNPPAEDTDYRDARVPGFALRARTSGVHSWRVQLPDRRWLTLGRVDEVSLDDARKAAQRARAKIALGEEIATKTQGADLTLSRFLDEVYEPWMRTHHRGHVEQVDRIRWAFPDFLETALSGMTAAAVERWRTHRKFRHGEEDEDRAVSRATLNRDVAALRSAFGKAAEWAYLTANPIASVKLLKEDDGAVVRYLSEDEERRLRATLKARDDARRKARESANRWRQARGYEVWPTFGTFTDYLTPLVLLALNTGLRRGELLQLRWRDINFDRKVLTVRGDGAKSGHTRHVPLNKEAIDVLRTWGPADDDAALVFPGEDASTPLTEVKRAWGEVLTKAEITAFRFHDLRHTFASKLVMAGVDLNTVRELLGHATLKMTLRYAHLAPEHKAAAVARLRPPTPTKPKEQKPKGQKKAA